MQETEKIKADNQISKNENLVQVWFFNQSHFKTNRKAVNLSQGRDSFPSPRGLCSPTHCTRHWVVWGCCHPAAWPGSSTGHRLGIPSWLCPCCPTTALVRAPAAREPQDLQCSCPRSRMRCSGALMSLGLCLGQVELSPVPLPVPLPAPPYFFVLH